MSIPPTLFSLQALDSDLDGHNERLTVIRASREETDELVDASRDVDRRQESLHQLQERLKDLEWTISDLTTKIERNEAKLYDGTIQNLKELDGFRREVEIEKRKRGQTEDELLEGMGAQEEEEISQGSARARLAEILATWKSHQEALTKEESQINRRVAKLVPERDQILNQIPTQTRSSYEKLRSSRRGLAVVTIERNNCGGCRIALPVVTIQRVRSNNQEVHCPSCGRFLVLSA